MLKFIKYALLSLLVLIFALLILLVSPPLWKRWITYPSLDRKVAEFQKLRKETTGYEGKNIYQGHFHLHSYWSHDSEALLEDIIPAAQKHQVDFLFLSDHPRGASDHFPRGYQGYYDGVLIEPGSERKGLNVWPLRPDTLNWHMDADSIVKYVVENGGLVIYSHTEVPHSWDNPWYQGMEIYNFHTDTKDESYRPIITNFLINGNKYRRWAYREIFDEQTNILKLWDEINLKRKVVGVGAIDTHENQNFRARKLADGRVEWLGPNAKPIDTVAVSWKNRWLFSEPDASGWVFKLMIDTYEAGFHYISNYLLTDTLSVPSIVDGFNKGHLYTAFKSLGDAKGFMYHARFSDGGIAAIMGDSIQMHEISQLQANAPLPGEFRIIHNGNEVERSEPGVYEYTYQGPFQQGVWRMEVHVNATGKTTPWVYSNPIYLY